MSVPGKRKCATCRYLADSGLAGNGWCTHPSRQVSSDVRILVRRGELACRNSWGGDLWEPDRASASSNGASRAEMSSFEASIPLPRLDDQVTSVVNSESNGATPQSAQPVSDDHLVAQDTIGSNTADGERRFQAGRRPLTDVNHLAHADQQERANVMARGGAREAILRARERHRQRNGIATRDDETPPIQSQTTAEQDDVVSSPTPVAPDDAREQRPDETPPPPLQDRVLDTRLQQSSPGTIDPFRRSYNDPAPPVPASELPAGAEALSTRDGGRTRFDSVPEIRPDLALPRRQPPVSPARRRAEAARQRIGAQDALGSENSSKEPNASTRRPYDRVAGPDNQSGRFSAEGPTGGPSQADQSRPIRAAARAARDNRPNRQVSRLTFHRSTQANDSIGDTPPVASIYGGAPHDRDMVEDNGRRTFPSEADDASIRAADLESPTEPETLNSVEAVGPTGPSHGVTERRAPNAFSMFDAEADAVSSGTPEFDDDLLDEPVTVRRRSWLTGLGRRRQSGSARHAPPAATFPLRAATPSRQRSQDEGIRAAMPPESGPDESTLRPEPGPDFAPNLVPAVVSDRVNQHMTAASSGEFEMPSAGPAPSPRSDEARSTRVDQAAASPASTSRRLPTVLPALADEALPPEQHADSESVPASSISATSRVDPSPTPRSRQKVPARPPVDNDDMTNLRQRLFGTSEGNGRSRASGVGEPHTAPAPEQEAEVPSPATREGEQSASIALEEEYPRVEAAPGFDLRNIVARQHDLLDMRVKLAPEVPRICRTCRSFRPSENDERGWCTSEYAFTHRRMVNAGDRPCESTIGCWWLPNDEVWLPDDALKAFEEPTPLMDSILNRYERRRVGER